MHLPCEHHDTGHKHADSAGDQPSNVVPFPRTKPASRTGVRVERIETEPMTSDEYRLAVTALAALINQWEHRKENPPETNEKAA
jgi:hypothetical protein